MAKHTPTGKVPSHSSYQAAKPAKKSGVSYPTLIIAVVVTVFLTFVIYTNVDNIKDFFQPTGQDTIVDTGSQTNLDLTLGEKITVDGLLTPDGDVVTHSHRLHNPEYGTLGIKSRTINLAPYEGKVKVTGVVERVYQSMYIVEVSEIQMQNENGTGDVQTNGGTTGDVASGDMYIPQAGVYFPSGFHATYELQSNLNNRIVLADVHHTGKTIAVSYFPCTRSNPNRDCAKLTQTFTNTAEKSFTNAGGQTYYKLSEVQSWFVANDDMFGYFLNDIQEQDVLALSKYITFVSAQRVRNNIVPGAADICTYDVITLTSVTEVTMDAADDAIYATLVGTDDTGLGVSCTVMVDPTIAAGATFVDMETFEVDAAESTDSNTNNTQDDTASTDNAGDEVFATDVEQFPIDTDNPFVFESRRGHKIYFPSMNISFAGTTVDADLGYDNISCFSQMNVVSFPNKPQVETNPSLKIYECTIKDDLPSNDRLLFRETVDGRDFIIQIVDPAWRSFALNTRIE